MQNKDGDSLGFPRGILNAVGITAVMIGVAVLIPILYHSPVTQVVWSWTRQPILLVISLVVGRLIAYQGHGSPDEIAKERDLAIDQARLRFAIIVGSFSLIILVVLEILMYSIGVV